MLVFTRRMTRRGPHRPRRDCRLHFPLVIAATARSGAIATPANEKVLARTFPEAAGPSAGRYDPFHAPRRRDMLVLSRKPGEKVIIGNGITVTVVHVKGNR